MTSIESFANTGASLEPLEMITGAAPVSCFWAAAAGAATAVALNWAAEKAVGYLNHRGGYVAEEAPELAGVTADMSGDALVALRTPRV
jgi:hypothetical protein